MGRTQSSRGSSGIRRTSPFPPENVTPRKGTLPHKFKVGQVVRWTAVGYRRIFSCVPLHCDGGCPSYYLEDQSRVQYSQGPVSESVLRALTELEKG